MKTSNPDLPAGTMRHVYLYGGALLLLINFAAPTSGLIDLPVNVFLQKRMHLSAEQEALFKLITGIPLYAAVVLGFLRDRWNPFGLGDRGHLMISGVVAAIIYALVAITPPQYHVFLLGMFAATVLFQIAAAAGNGMVAAIGQQHAAAGRMSMLTNLPFFIAVTASLVMGGWESNFLEGRSIGFAAQAIFLLAAALMLVLALFGWLAPRDLFGAARRGAHRRSVLADIGVLMRHRPLYPVLLLQLLWQFSPATGVALQFHFTNTLHGSDAAWGQWNAIWLGSFLPVTLAYGWLCRKISLKWLLIIGTLLGATQEAPLMLLHSVSGANWAAVWLGIGGGVLSLSINDLLIRSAPPGFQGSAVMLFSAMLYFGFRGGDVLGARVYAAHGYFAVALLTVLVNALCLPGLLLVPRRLMRTKDGEAIPL